MKETKEMMAILHNNKLKAIAEERELQEVKKIERKEKKERNYRIITLVGILSIISLILVIKLGGSYTDKQVERCIENGNSARVCEELRK